LKSFPPNWPKFDSFCCPPQSNELTIVSLSLSIHLCQQNNNSWFDDFLQAGGVGDYGDNLAMLFSGPGMLSRVMRVEVFNSALRNDRALQPQVSLRVAAFSS
jgi:hypothetical protein